MKFEGAPREEEKKAPLEREGGFEVESYVTDHSADNPDTGSPERLRELYADVRRDGIQSVRYDWRWQNIEPRRGERSDEHLSRYGEAKKIMEEVGLEEPTVILSSMPEWAKKLYEEDKESFFEAYRGYVEQVVDELSRSGGGKVSRVQVFNEVNLPWFTPIRFGDFPRVFDITRETFREYNPDVKLMVTLAVGSLNELAAKFGKATSVGDALIELKKIKDKFDVIALDYYPGLWHLPLKEAGWEFKDIFKQLGLLKSTFEEVAVWGKEYELGEVGLPTNKPWSNEKRQRYFYDTFFRAFKHLTLDFQSRGTKLPSRIGFYQAIDEPPRTLLGRVLRKTPFPEHDLGMRLRGGKRKLILQGSPHVPETERTKKPSQLKKILEYLRAPMKKKDAKEPRAFS